MKRGGFKKNTYVPEPRSTVGHGEDVDMMPYAGMSLDAVTDLHRDEVPDPVFNMDFDKDIPDAERMAVHERSGRVCEVRGHNCTGQAQHIHHRKLRRFHDHRAINLLDVCLHCHHDIHAHVKVSYLFGWMVRSTDDPAQVALTVTPLP